MRIGVNALYLIPGGVGGTEIYLRSLLRAFAELDREDRFIVFTNQETPADIAPAAENFAVAQQDLRASFRPGRILWEQFRLPFATPVDVMFNPGFTAPLWLGRRNVTVFHDLQHKRHPEHFRWFDLPFWNILLRGSASLSGELIAVSQATRADLNRFYGSHNVTVAEHGVGDEFRALSSQRSPERVLLCVSTLHPHKNIERLVRVFARFHAARPEYRLVLAGMKGFQTKRILEAIAETGLRDAVEVTGWIPREQLLNLYRRAAAFIYPSTFEGFGMPVLEAMAAGIPTACSDIDPLRGIVGEAALLFNPSDDADMLAALHRVVDDRDGLSRKGPLRASEFTWQRAAQITLDVIHRAAQRK